MITVIFENKKISQMDYTYNLVDVLKCSETLVDIHLMGDIHDFWFTYVANETIINGVVQTSADMIIETLTNG